VLLALSALARGGEVIVSRGELIEIGGSFRMPDVIAQSGATLVEVGTTNKTRIEDYERAIGPQTRLILRSHPSNYRIVGFTAQPARTELAALARRHGVPLLEDLGSGTLVDLRRFGLPAEPTVQTCVRDGGGLVAFSGDKLLGGPQAGLVVGPAELVQQLRQHPLARALRIDKLSLAALEATLRLYDGAAPPEQSIPALRMLAAPQAGITRAARRLVRRLRERAPQLVCTLRAGESLAGGGSLPEAVLPTTLVMLDHPRLPPQELARRLRAGTPAVVGRMVAERYALDLRTVAAAEIAPLADAIAQAAAAAEA
jgi:L-seryl-tRNA(Ser) seleniumtransferase